jgi:hypothetical protein
MNVSKFTDIVYGWMDAMDGLNGLGEPIVEVRCSQYRFLGPKRPCSFTRPSERSVDCMLAGLRHNRARRQVVRATKTRAVASGHRRLEVYSLSTATKVHGGHRLSVNA